MDEHHDTRWVTRNNMEWQSGLRATLLTRDAVAGVQALGERFGQTEYTASAIGD